MGRPPQATSPTTRARSAAAAGPAQRQMAARLLAEAAGVIVERGHLADDLGFVMDLSFAQATAAAAEGRQAALEREAAPAAREMFAARMAAAEAQAAATTNPVV